MGGKGTWLTALDDPTLYANITTFSAVAVHPTTAGARLAGVPHLHIICGGDDGDFAAGSQAMYAAIKPALGDRVELTVVPHEGHGVWGRYYPDPAFYKDLMAYHR
jgi:dienelactone hydrolase